MNGAIVGGVEFLSFQALWFVVAGFILGFAASTLWEWLYYRGKRRAHLEELLPTGVASPRTDRGPDSNDEVVEEVPASGWTVPYRSPRVYLESEQLAAVESADAALVAAQAPPSLQSTGERSVSSPVPGEVKAPRLNPTTLAALQAAVAQTPITQVPANHTGAAELPATAALANTEVYDTPSFDSLAVAPPLRLEATPALSPVAPYDDPVTVAPVTLAQPAVALTPVVSASFPEPATRQPPVQPLQAPGVEAAVPHDHPDDLALIKGVGEAYKRRLYGAGIYTWRQVAESDTENLRRITRAKPNANIGAWRERAKELAEKYQRWQSTFQGPLDDLTRIDGIGAITADILYKAGICTYDQLAGALPDELAQIVPAPTVGDEVDFDGWINTAVRLANTKRRNQGLLS